MSARAEIIARIRNAHGECGLSPIEHPGRFAHAPVEDAAQRFVEVATAGGARVVSCTRSALPQLVHEIVSAEAVIVSSLSEVSSHNAPLQAGDGSLTALADVGLFVTEGQLGVAESGAIWISAPDSAPRAALFLAEHVLLVLAADRIVGTMHEAYDRIDVTASPFGCFVAGPSKTADIEQSLVVGAHGPTGLTIALVR